jgi:hypothetical protein
LNCFHPATAWPTRQTTNRARKKMLSEFSLRNFLDPSHQACLRPVTRKNASPATMISRYVAYMIRTSACLHRAVVSVAGQWRTAGRDHVPAVLERRQERILLAYLTWAAVPIVATLTLFVRPRDVFLEDACSQGFFADYSASDRARGASA